MAFYNNNSFALLDFILGRGGSAGSFKQLWLPNLPILR